jgi:hypothetical protein
VIEADAQTADLTAVAPGPPFDRLVSRFAPLAARVNRPLAPPAVGAPGPLGLAEPQRMRALLATAGWSDIIFNAVDGLCDFSVGGSDGVEERLEMALNGTIGQALRAKLEPQLGLAGWADVLEEARAELRAGLVDGTVRFVGHTRVVTARNPSPT